MPRLHFCALFWLLSGMCQGRKCFGTKNIDNETKREVVVLVCCRCALNSKMLLVSSIYAGVLRWKRNAQSFSVGLTMFSGTGLTLSNVCDVLNVIARAEDAVAEANPKDELSESLIVNIKAIGMAFAAQHGTAVIEGAQFSELLPRIAKEFLLKLGKLKLLKT